MLEERRHPYTPQQIRLMFPVLTEVECLMVADIEERFPRWHVWPRGLPADPCLAGAPEFHVHERPGDVEAGGHAGGDDELDQRELLLMAGAAVTRFSFTCPEPGDLAWLQSRWRHRWDLGWDDEYVAVSKDGGTTVFAPTADAMNQALKLDGGIRLLREMTAPGRPGRAERLR